MTVYVIRRLLQASLVLVVMSALVFVGVFALGNPVHILASPDADQNDIERIVRAFGLDRPLWEQYGRFMGQALIGDLGKSFQYREPVIGLILRRLPATIELAVAALVLTAGISVPLGLWAGMKPKSLSGRAIMVGSILGFSLPAFWFGLMLILVFAVFLGWLPASGRGATRDLWGIPLSVLTADGWRHLLLPALTLSLFKMALVLRLVRASTSEAVLTDYVKFARAKGLRPRRIVGVHILKNILIPVVTVMGIEFGHLLTFAVVTESIFAWPGMGKLLIESIYSLDRPVVVAYLLVTVTIIILLNLLVDLVYALLDPRVKLEGKTA